MLFRSGTGARHARGSHARSVLARGQRHDGLQRRRAHAHRSRLGDGRGPRGLQSARVQREQYFGEWLPEPIVTNMGSDPFGIIKIDESLSMAFLVLLERLTPVERAVFLLREVFEYEYSEVAKIIGQSETNCRQILRRARQPAGSPLAAS